MEKSAGSHWNPKLLFAEVDAVLASVPVDFGGGCSQRKAHVMAYLIERFSLRTALDIGVYRGRSFLPMCAAMRRLGRGKVYAVDPWSRDAAREFDNHVLRDEIDSWADRLDFEGVYQGVLAQINAHRFGEIVYVSRTTSKLAALEFAKKNLYFDLIHIDGNHDTDAVLDDVAAYLPLLAPGGFLILDDVSWDSVKPAVSTVLRTCIPFLRRVTQTPEDDYAVFCNDAGSQRVQVALQELPEFAGTDAVFGSAAATTSNVVAKPAPPASTASTTPQSRSAKKLLICDDFFPNVLTAFRVAEYNALLDTFPHATVRSWASHFRGAHEYYSNLYPAYAKRVAACTEYSFANAGFVYTNFLNNAVQLLGFYAMRSPFAFVLYPGGGFGLNDPESDGKLQFALQSPLLRAVVVTTSITEQYLLEKISSWGIDRAIEVVRIDGVTIINEYFRSSVGDRTYWAEDRDELNICFAANKYLPRLEHKGYQEFVHAARDISAAFPFVRLHVVGGADSTDGDFGECVDRVTFHGMQESANLRALFHTMDLIVSPSLVGKVHTGQFDGVPTATCVEASLCGVGMVVTNPLNLAEKYSAAAAIKIVQPTVESVRDGLNEIVRNAVREPASLRRLGQAGRAVSREVYNLNAQMAPRIAMIERYLNAA